MFKFTSDSIEITFFELVSILAFAAVGYSLLYKFSFYYSLGVPWYLSTISPLSIFITSLLFLILNVIGGLLGFLIGNTVIKLDEKFNSLLISLIALSCQLILVLITVPSWGFWSASSISGYIDIILIHLIFLTAIPASLITVAAILHLKGKRNFTLLKVYKLAFGLIIIYALVSYIYGNLEAQAVLKKNSLSEVLINVENKDGKISEKWYLIDFIGDKALLMKNEKKKVFKVVEYKDILSLEVGLSRIEKIDEKLKFK